jgi:hypothetical protein
VAALDLKENKTVGFKGSNTAVRFSKKKRAVLAYEYN